MSLPLFDCEPDNVSESDNGSSFRRDQSDLRVGRFEGLPLAPGRVPTLRPGEHDGRLWIVRVRESFHALVDLDFAKRLVSGHRFGQVLAEDIRIVTGDLANVPRADAGGECGRP